MSDLISRQALMKEFADFVRASNNSDFSRTPTWNDAVSLVGSMPSAQPEIIHCQNCKHWREGDAYSYCQKLFNCGVLDVYDYMRAEDDFCSLAERRTDE